MRRQEPGLLSRPSAGSPPASEPAAVSGRRGAGEAGGAGQGRGEFSEEGPGGSNFSVVVRVRPLIERELTQTPAVMLELDTSVPGRHVARCREISGNEVLDTYAASHVFTFDRIFPQDASQETVYAAYVRRVIGAVFDGVNCTVLAYGQSSSGKTFTMVGERQPGQLYASGVLGHSGRWAGPGVAKGAGIIPRIVDDIFAEAARRKEEMEAGGDAPTRYDCVVYCSYLQIYNERIQDILCDGPVNLRSDMRIRESGRDIYVENLTEHEVSGPADVWSLLEKGNFARTTEATRVNDFSSRSHACFQIVVDQAITRLDPATGQPLEQRFIMGKVNLVDLAGSERVGLSNVAGQRLEETKQINKSLAALGNVVSALVEREKGRATHIPYRDSKLTRLLQDSLGGSSLTILLATVSPSAICFSETLSTLGFASRAKHIQNVLAKNEVYDTDSLLRKYSQEVAELRQKLAERQSRSSRAPAGKTAVEGNEQADLLGSPTSPDSQTRPRASDPALQNMLREYVYEQRERRRLEEQVTLLETKIASLKRGDLLSRAAGPGAAEALPPPHPGRGAQADLHAQLYSMDSDISRKLRHSAALMGAEVASARDAGDGPALSRELQTYQSILLKQRDLLITTTDRLQNRDEMLASLREEFDSVQRYNRFLEIRNEMLSDIIAVCESACDLSGDPGEAGEPGEPSGSRDSVGQADPGIPGGPDRLDRQELPLGKIKQISALEAELRALEKSVESQRYQLMVADVKAALFRSYEKEKSEELSKIVQGELCAALDEMDVADGDAASGSAGGPAGNAVGSSVDSPADSRSSIAAGAGAGADPGLGLLAGQAIPQIPPNALDDTQIAALSSYRKEMEALGIIFSRKLANGMEKIRGALGTPEAVLGPAGSLYDLLSATAAALQSSFT